MAINDKIFDEAYAALNKALPDGTKIAGAADYNRQVLVFMIHLGELPAGAIMAYCMKMIAYENAEEIDRAVALLNEMRTPESDPKKVM